MSEVYRVESARNGTVRTLQLCDIEVCPVPKVVRNNPDRLSHVISFIRSFAGDLNYPHGMTEQSITELSQEWESVWANNPSTLRAALSAAAVCSVCTHECDYAFTKNDGCVIEEGTISKLAL